MLAIRQVFMWLSFSSSCYMWSPFDQTACTLSLCQGIQTFSPTILRGCVILTARSQVQSYDQEFLLIHYTPKELLLFQLFHLHLFPSGLRSTTGLPKTIMRHRICGLCVPAPRRYWGINCSEQGGLGLIISCCNYLSGIIAATHWNLNTGSINRTCQQLVPHWCTVNLCSWILNFTNRLARLVKYTPILNSTFDNSY